MKKAAATAGKKEKNVPEPVPVVEEPPKPSPEELEALAKAEDARKQKAANIARVSFPTLPIKKIVSYHASTILAAESPVQISLTDTKENEIRIAFRHKSSDRGFVLYDEIAEVFASLMHFTPEQPDYQAHLEFIESLLPRFLPKEKRLDYQTDVSHSSVPGIPGEGSKQLLSDPAHLSSANLQFSEHEFVAYFLEFFAPSFHYGQHLRLYSGRNCPDNVKELLHRGCAINTPNGEGLTALHIACEHNHVQIIDVLLQAHTAGHPMLQLHLNGQDKYGWTPLHCAVFHGSLASIQKLLSLTEVNVNITTQDGKTPLHFACMQNRGTVVPLLLHAGARFSAVDNCGRTPLHEAAYKGHHSLFQEYSLLLAEGITRSKAASSYEGKNRHNKLTGNEKSNEDKLNQDGAEVMLIQDSLRYTPSQYFEIDDTNKIFV